MKKIAFAFDITIIGLLFGNSLSATTDFIKGDFWNEFTVVLLIALAVSLLFTGILKRNKS